MSRRVLVYSEYRIFRVCDNFLGSDGGTQTYISYFSIGLAGPSSNKTRSLNDLDWCRVVEEYCHRKFD